MILVVDDDPNFLDEARVRLDAGNGVFLACGAEQANSLIDAVGVTFSLAVVDLDMHGQNGFDLIVDWRRRYPNLPIVAMSGVYQRNVLESARMMGAIDVLRKPIDSEWMTVIRRAREHKTPN